MFNQPRIVQRVLALIVLVLSFRTFAQTTLHIRTNDSTTQDFAYTSGAAVPSIPVDATTTKLNVWVTPASTTNLGAITLTLPQGSSAPSVLSVVIGPQTGFPIAPDAPILSPNFGCLDWAGITTDSPGVQASIQLLAGLHGSVTGDVTVGRVFRIEAGGTGEIRAAISGTNSNSGTDKPVEFVVASRITSSGSIRTSGGDFNNGDITEVSIGGGGIEGTISASQGGIGTIHSTGPITIASPGEIMARDSIVSINATGQDVSASIVAGTLGSSGVGLLSLTCRDLAGSITTGALGVNNMLNTPSIAASGTVSATIQTTVDVGARIDVVGDITGNITIGGSCRAPIAASGLILGAIDIGTATASGGNLTASIVGTLGISSVRVRGDINRGTTSPVLQIASEQGSIGSIVVDGDVFPNPDAPGRDVEIVCAGTLNELLVGRQFFGAIRRPAEPYYVDCGVIRINTTHDDGFPMKGDFWIKSFTEFDVWEYIEADFSGDMLHLASVPFGRTLRIGNFLSIDTDIDDMGGLKGQVAINARGLTANFDRWTQTTRVRTTAGTFVTLQDANSSDNTYATQAGVLGGGAIGVVRYTLHDEDCIPGEGTETNPAQFTQSNFNNGGGIVLTKYGRLLVVPSTADAVTITRGETPVNSLFEVTLGTGSATRQIKIRPKAVGYPAQRLPVAIGKYRIEPTAALRCADTFEENDPPAVAPFTYVVCVVRDCDHDGLPDSGDPSCSLAVCAPGSGDCLADCDNGTGTGTPDGGVTVDDLLYYLNIFELGLIDADIDDGSQTSTRDGGVTIDDLIYYIQHFEAGC